ncbi:hypothetical protein RRG08_008541 [Elysia crispata]|uniref:Uncharacterized protein n=1 Tax=Elysia crispata TaxID=231223 RepID=A0AAE0YFA5_9GAST|nr:hypothetical protein RRG08_008541 [Elysia crispata]
MDIRDSNTRALYSTHGTTATVKDETLLTPINVALHPLTLLQGHFVTPTILIFPLQSCYVNGSCGHWSPIVLARTWATSGELGRSERSTSRGRGGNVNLIAPGSGRNRRRLNPNLAMFDRGRAVSWVHYRHLIRRPITVNESLAPGLATDQGARDTSLIRRLCARSFGYPIRLNPSMARRRHLNLAAVKSSSSVLTRGDFLVYRTPGETVGQE